MFMNYTLSHIKIKSNWFEEKSKYIKIGHIGFDLYLSLFKFRLHKQEHNYFFITSISLLRKETGYSTLVIYEYLKLFKKLKIIKVENVSRWDYLLDENGEIKDKEVLVITAADVPNLIEDANKKEIPVTEDDYYVSVDLDLMEYYKDNGLNEKYYGLYCLMKKLSNGNPEGKSYMTIENMSEVLGYDKDYVNKMVHEMNKRNILYSKKRRNMKKNHYFEHYLCPNMSKIDEFRKFCNDRNKNK